MLNIIVVDRSAGARTRLVSLLHQALEQRARHAEILPRVSIKPLSREELQFHQAPEICLIGEELISEELTEVARIRKLLPDTAIIVHTQKTIRDLGTIEQLARLGADDVLSAEVGTDELVKRIVLLSRKTPKNKTGQLIIVDSGKGGSGVTTIAAALGELLLAKDKRVVLLDGDTQTQDLSRFLQVRPFINENLALLFSKSRPVTQEFVDECAQPVWIDTQGFFCIPALPDSDDLFDPTRNHSKTLLGILEVLDSRFDVVIVDVGSFRGQLLRTLYRVADRVVFLVGNDPASLHASADKLNQISSWIDAETEITVVENAPTRSGLTEKLLRIEFSRAAKLDSSKWFSKPIPFCKQGQRWPGSGNTLASAGSGQILRVLRQLSERVLDARAESFSVLPAPERSLFGRICRVFSRRRITPQASNPNAPDYQKLLTRIANVSNISQHKIEIDPILTEAKEVEHELATPKVTIGLDSEDLIGNPQIQ